MRIRLFESDDFEEWLRLRLALWPENNPEEMRAEMQALLEDDDQAVLVAERPAGGLGGMLEVSLRKYADGCDTSPVGYLEGWYVDLDLRRLGLGSALVRAAEDWARRRGCREMASDTEIANISSLAAHIALGYEEAERLIHFRKTL
jgi:aminoglycoside 6'-N-acetyltransferase I